MIEQLTDMPDGTIGFRASGDVTREEYRDVLEPAMREAVEAGEIRLMFVVASDFERFKLGALAEDTKTGIQLGIGHHSAWKRCAIVTDIEWMRHATNLFAWMAPGELQVFGLDAESEARAWVAG
jgi:SpoIIAA-like